MYIYIMYIYISHVFPWMFHVFPMCSPWLFPMFSRCLSHRQKSGERTRPSSTEERRDSTLDRVSFESSTWRDGTPRSVECGIFFLLVGGWATPLKNMTSSIGMIRNPIYGKIKNVPNHQPVCVSMRWLFS